MISLETKDMMSGTRRVLAVHAIMGLVFHAGTDPLSRVIHMIHTSEYLTDSECEEVLQMVERNNPQEMAAKCEEIAMGVLQLVRG